MRSDLVIVALLTLCLPAPLTAAEPKPAPPKPMQVLIAHSTEPGCEPDCAEWISAEGVIDDTTPKQFKRVFAALGERRLPVLVSSAGGRVEPAMEIGRMIRSRGLDVFVTKTAVKPCRSGDAACTKRNRRDVHTALPDSRLSLCASSCAFILAGGVHRHVGGPTLVGLHQITTYRVLTRVLQKYKVVTSYQTGVPVTTKSLVSQKTLSQSKQTTGTSKATYDKIRTYFVEMGIAESVMPILMSTPNSSIRWLKRHELTATNLATDFDTAERALLRVKAEAPAMPSPATTVAIPPAAMPQTMPDAPVIPPVVAALPIEPTAEPAAPSATPAPPKPRPTKAAAAPAAKPSAKPKASPAPDAFARESR